MAVLRRKTLVVKNMLARFESVKGKLEGKAEEAMNTLTDYKNNMYRPTGDIQRKMLTERFIVEAKELFNSARERETSANSGISVSLRQEEVFSTIEILGGFACWLGLLKKEGFFVNLVNQYESGIGSGNGANGYRMGPGVQAWGYRQGGYGQGGWGGMQQVSW